MSLALRSLHAPLNSRCILSLPAKRKRVVLRPVGSDPGAVCQKNYFLKVIVSLSEFGACVAHGNFV